MQATSTHAKPGYAWGVSRGSETSGPKSRRFGVILRVGVSRDLDRGRARETAKIPRYVGEKRTKPVGISRRALGVLRRVVGLVEVEAAARTSKKSQNSACVPKCRGFLETPSMRSWRSTVTKAVATCRSSVFVRPRERRDSAACCTTGLRRSSNCASPVRLLEQ